VLYVDDDVLQLRAFATALAAPDRFIVTAATPEEGLLRLKDRTFAIIASDYAMPGMNGVDFLVRAAAEQPDAVRLLVTGHCDFETAADAINRVGVHRFIPKPWDRAGLRALLDAALAQFRLTKEHQEMVVRLREMNRHLDSMVSARTSELLLSLCNALDLRDTDTQWHSRRVALYSDRLAAELGIAGQDRIDIERGALLHDVGKIGVSDTILLKPGKLTEEEWVQMRKHVDLGTQILRDIAFLGRSLLLVQQHHERWDGKGYTQGLKGEEIYIGARIFAAIDTYDAVTSDRPYRKGRDHATAVAEIANGKGSQFDPQVVDAMLRIPAAEMLAIRERASAHGAGIT
jgi:putative nucleotidyltransferase with HDIG domain